VALAQRLPSARPVLRRGPPATQVLDMIEPGCASPILSTADGMSTSLTYYERRHRGLQRLVYFKPTPHDSQCVVERSGRYSSRWFLPSSALISLRHPEQISAILAPHEVKMPQKWVCFCKTRRYVQGSLISSKAGRQSLHLLNNLGDSNLIGQHAGNS